MGGADDPRIGTLLGERYRILRRLGEGGMGVVYEAEHTLIRRRVAVKLLHALHTASPELRTRFEREAHSATAVRHRNVVEVLDMGTAPDGAAYIVLEFLEGRDWARLIEAEGPQPLDRTVQIALQVCAGLAAVHDAGIVHRDLKVENVFLVEEPGGELHVKIVDFGISKILGDDDPTAPRPLTQTGNALGTPYAMAPEQLRGARDVDHRADLYALGVMLYRALTGRPPFEGATFAMLAVEVMTASPPPLAKLRPDLPPSLQPILDRLLAKSPADRYATAKEVAAQLARFAHVTPMMSAPTIAAPSPTPATAPPAPSASPAAPPATVASAARAGGGSPVIGLVALAVVATGALLVLAISATLIALHDGDEPVPVAWAPPDPADPEPPAIPTPPPAIDASAACARACTRLAECGSGVDGSCTENCGSSTMAECVVGLEARGASTCDELASCVLAATCAGVAPAGAASCHATAQCEAACSLRDPSDSVCTCACVAMMQPSASLELLANNACAVVRCPDVCNAQTPFTSCLRCFSRRCARESRACRES